MSVSPAKVKPNPTNAARNPQRGFQQMASVRAMTIKRPAPKRTWRSSDQRDGMLRTVGKPELIHAPVPPSRTEISRLQGPSRPAVMRARLPIWQMRVIGLVGLRSSRRDSICSIGMLMAPGMCPDANSDGERTSINWEPAGLFFRSAMVTVRVNCPPNSEERWDWEKDSGSEWPTRRSFMAEIPLEADGSREARILRLPRECLAGAQRSAQDDRTKGLFNLGFRNRGLDLFRRGISFRRISSSRP